MYFYPPKIIEADTATRPDSMTTMNNSKEGISLIAIIAGSVPLKAVGNYSSGTKQTDHANDSQDDISLRPDHSLVITILRVSLEAFLIIF